MTTENPERGSAVYLTLLSLVAALGGLLFGYDTAVIAGAIGFMQKHLLLDSTMMGWAAASALLGCVIGVALAGELSDRLGRRGALLVAGALFLVSAIGSALPRSLGAFIFFRILGGLGVGIASMTSPMYIAEVSPARLRGRMVSVNQFAIVTGMLVVYFVNYYIAGAGDEAWNVTTGWRWMFASEAVPCVLFLGLLLAVPETPRWLVQRGRGAEARAVLARIEGAAFAEREVADIERAVREDAVIVRGLRFTQHLRVAAAASLVLVGLLHVISTEGYAARVSAAFGATAEQARGWGVGAAMAGFVLLCAWLVGRGVAEIEARGLRRALVIGVVLAVLQQVTGINVFLYYAPEIFKGVAGARMDAALLQTIAVGAVNLAFTVLAIWSVDRVGRRPLMIAGAAGMGISLAAIGLAACLKAVGAWLLVFILGYIAAFAIAVGPVTWVILSEIYPTRIRSCAMAIATFCLWVANYVVSQTFPMMDQSPALIARFNHGFPFWVYGAFCAVLVAVVVRWVPETKGRSLEDIERMWLGKPRAGAD